MNNELLRALVDLRDRQIQKGRIQFTNRLSALDRGMDNGNARQYVIVERWMKRFDEMERELDRDIADMVQEYEIYKFVSSLKGVGPMLSAKLIAMIDISLSSTVSSLWRYAGYGVMEGERERPVKGEKLHYNTRLKTTCYLIGTSFLRANSPYRQVYDDAREYYAANRPEWTKGHSHQASMRKMIKRFLSHYWEVARTLEGLPIRAPYVQDYLGHEHIDRPEDYGWPVIGETAKTDL